MQKRKLGKSNYAIPADSFARTVAFAITQPDVDDHLHNHGFLHAGRGHWRLAPAFDLNPFHDRTRGLKI